MTKTAKRGSNYTAIIGVPGLDPAEYVVSAVVMRRDGTPLSDAEFALCARALPAVTTPKALMDADARADASSRDTRSTPEDDQIIAAGRALGAKKPAGKPAKKAPKRAKKAPAKRAA